MCGACQSFGCATIRFTLLRFTQLQGNLSQTIFSDGVLVSLRHVSAMLRCNQSHCSSL
jgi:hypothetical protein